MLLSLLPLLPTQDGGAHVATGSMWWDCLLGRAPADLVYELRSGMTTNLLSNLVLGGMQACGLGPRPTEALFVLALLGLLVLAWRVLLRRLGAPPWTMVLVLWPFGGLLLHMGFYNFLLGVHLALLGFALRGDRVVRPISELLFVLALLAHPLGAATWLALVAGQACLRLLPGLRTDGDRVALRHTVTVLIALLPHGLVLWWATRVSAGEVVPDLAASAMPTVAWQAGWPDLLGEVFVPIRGEAAGWALALRVVLLAVLVGGWSWTWRTAMPAERRLRILLGLLAMPPLLLSGLAPSMLGFATHLRPRAAYLAWLLLLPALAPRRRAQGPGERAWLGRIRVGFMPAVVPALVLALFTLVSVTVGRLAFEQQALLDRLPRPASGAIVVAGFDQMTRDALLRLPQPGGVIAEPLWPVTYRPRSLADNREHLGFEPWLHLGYRWAHEGGALNLNNHQAWYPHSPLRYREVEGGGKRRSGRPSLEFRNLIEYSARFFPVARAGGLCDELLLMNLPEDWPLWLEPQLGEQWRIDGRGPDFVRLVAVGGPGPTGSNHPGGEGAELPQRDDPSNAGPRVDGTEPPQRDRPPAAGSRVDVSAALLHPLLHEPIPHGNVPIWLLPGQDSLVEAGPLRAHRRFLAYLIAADLRCFFSAPASIADPGRGRFDAEGRFRFVHLAPPARPQGLLVLLPQ